MANGPAANGSATDRRSGTQLEGVATVFGLFGEDFGRIHEVVRVDRDGDRLWGEACEPLRIGMTVCVGFQARGMVARRGVVEASDLVDSGWLVRIRLEGELVA